MKHIFILGIVGIMSLAHYSASAGTPISLSTTLYSLKTNSQISSHAVSDLRSINCDTIFNFTSDTTAIYLLQRPAEGYLSGTGAVQSGLEIGGIGERLSDPGATGQYVTSAITFFGIAKMNSTDSALKVTAYVYDTTGLSAYGGPAPGNALDSASVTLGSIARDITNNHNPTVFQFANQPALTTDVFFITIAMPTKADTLPTGDTLVIYTTTVSSGSGDGWIDIPANGGWASYENLLHDQIGDFIEASVCSARSCPSITFSATQIPGTTSAYATATGGALPYTYTWNSTPSQSTDTATGLTIGTTYIVTVTDHNGCSGVASVTMSSCPAITATTAQIGATSASVSPSGGAQPYTYSWNTVPAQTTDTATGLTAGNTYSVTATDHNGCTVSASVTLSSCPTITVAASEIGSSTSADASASGGTGPYTYSWSNSQSTDTATGLVNGNSYTVTATDHNGCTGIATVSISTGIELIGGMTAFSIYPNPSNGIFTVHISLVTASDMTISITDMAGSKIYESIDKTIKDLNKQINLSTIASGIYFVSVKTAQGTANQRIIIK